MNSHKKKIGLIIAICAIHTHLFGAATSTSTQTASTIKVNIAREIRSFNKNILLKMPYFRARLNPANYMLTIPAYANYKKIAAQALLEQSPTFMLPSPIKLDDFMFLYNELAQISTANPLEDIIKRISSAGATPERILTLLNLAQELLTVEAILPVLDEQWITMLKTRLASEDGIIAKAFFAPQENLLETVLALIKAEQKEIKVASYRVTHPEIVCELARAKNRGVRVSVIVDKNDSEPDEIKRMHKAGLYLYLWQRNWFNTKPKMHHKFFLFTQNVNDKPFLVTGSANYTWSAQEKNEENIVVLNDQTLIDEFNKEWGQLKHFSEYQRQLWDTTEQYIADCLKLDQGNSHIFTQEAHALYTALVHLYVEYLFNGLIEPYGITSAEAQHAVSEQLARHNQLQPEKL